MCAVAVLDGLDERGPPFVVGRVLRLLECCTRYCVDGERVEAVDSDPLYSVRCGLLGDGFTGSLVFARDRNRPLVVVTDEDGGDVEDAGEVEALVEVAFGGRPVAEVTEDGSIRLSLSLPSPRPYRWPVVPALRSEYILA